MLLLRSRRLLFLLIAITISFLLLNHLHHFHDLPTIHVTHFLPEKASIPQATAPPPSEYDPALVSFWTELSTALTAAKPACPDVPATGPGTGVEAPINHFSKLGASFSYRPELIRIPEDHVDALRDAHAQYIGKIPELATQLPYEKGVQGIVTTAAGSFVPILIVSLRMLRRTGSTLPVEVFMESPAVDEPEICQDVLPALNAKCMILSEILDTPDRARMEPTKYQLKAFALLFSSFEDVLLLDADNLAMQKPEELFATEPYTSTGMVTWSDYWANTASPLFYFIAGISDPPSTSLRASTESGQLLLSKSTHTPTLLLTLYYNLYGPSHYYSLLSQGAVGQGDKETYLPAAMALNQTFYAVQTGPEALQFKTPKGNMQGAGALQANPHDDWKIHQAPVDAENDHKKSNDSTDTAAEAAEKTNDKPGIAFIHAQTYKLDAAKLPKCWHEEIETRMFGPAAEVEQRFGGRDVEREVWGELLWTACQVGPERVREWRKEYDGGGRVCLEVKKIYSQLYG